MPELTYEQQVDGPRLGLLDQLHHPLHPEGEAMTDKPIQAPLDLETS